MNYLDTSTSKPSDSFPGLMALVTGGSPRTVGAFYDVAYDRSLDPPATTTGNGVAGAPDLARPVQRRPAPPPNSTKASISTRPSSTAERRPAWTAVSPPSIPQADRDPGQGCAPVYPWNFVRTNTIFGVIHAAGGYTAWSDKHPSYSSVPARQRHQRGRLLLAGDQFDPGEPAVNVPGCNPLPDQTAVAASNAWTDSFQNIQCYDTLKVQCDPERDQRQDAQRLGAARRCRRSSG